MATITLRPTGYSDPSGNVTNPTYAYDGNQATYTSLTAATRSNTTIAANNSLTASSLVYYDFDLSSIPSNATIIAATLYAYCYITTTAATVVTGKMNQTSTTTIVLFNNATSVASISVSGTSGQLQAYTFSAAAITSWFSSSLPRVRAYSYSRIRNTSKTTGRIREGRTTVLYVSDIYINVEYELPVAELTAKNKLSSGWVQNTIKIKKNGEIISPTDAYVKVDGLWLPIK